MHFIATVDYSLIRNSNSHVTKKHFTLPSDYNRATDYTILSMPNEENYWIDFLFLFIICKFAL